VNEETQTAKAEVVKPAAKAETTKAEAGKRYTALTPIEHNGKPIAVGKTVALSEDEAAPLLACNPPAIEPIGKKTAEPTE
jgi:hypothetical protein